MLGSKLVVTSTVARSNRSCEKYRTPAKFRHGLAGRAASHELKSLIPRHHFFPKKGKKTNLCVRYELFPMCQVAHIVVPAL